MKKEKKNKLIADFNDRVLDSIVSSKVLKYSKIVVTITSALVAVGYLAKILNFSISNVKVLAKTIKNN